MNAKDKQINNLAAGIWVIVISFSLGFLCAVVIIVPLVILRML
jgi:hypothetical protein